MKKLYLGSVKLLPFYFQYVPVKLHDETMHHLLYDCPFSLDIYNLSPFPCPGRNPEHEKQCEKASYFSFPTWQCTAFGVNEMTGFTRKFPLFQLF